MNVLESLENLHLALVINFEFFSYLANYLIL
jgi:hypothetical protein